MRKALFRRTHDNNAFSINGRTLSSSNSGQNLRYAAEFQEEKKGINMVLDPKTLLILHLSKGDRIPKPTLKMFGVHRAQVKRTPVIDRSELRRCRNHPDPCLIDREEVHYWETKEQVIVVSSFSI